MERGNLYLIIKDRSIKEVMKNPLGMAFFYSLPLFPVYYGAYNLTEGEDRLKFMALFTAILFIGGIISVLMQLNTDSKQHKVVGIEEYNLPDTNDYTSMFKEELNDIVKTEDGKVRRLYQLIDDSNILNTFSIDYDTFDKLNVLPIKGNIIKQISTKLKRDELDRESKVIYDVGNTIPKLSKEEINNILEAISYSRDIVIQERLISEYEVNYKELSENNKLEDISPKPYLKLSESVNKEVVKLNSKLEDLTKENSGIISRR